MVFRDEDKILIKNLYRLKGYKEMELTKEFPNKWWIKSSIKRRLKKIKRHQHSQQFTGRGRSRSAALKKMFTWLTIWF